jgi:hypothetical protein
MSMILNQQLRKGASWIRVGLIATFLVVISSFAPSAFAGQWVQTGRAVHLDSEGIAPYAVFWTNYCHGGVAGPTGVYTYGETGPEGYGSCPTDVSTGWAANIGSHVGYCRPDPESMGGGYSCEERTYTIVGQPQLPGTLPSSCSVPGTYALTYFRRAELVYFGSGDNPNDYYDRVLETSLEYYCQ